MAVSCSEVFLLPQSSDRLTVAREEIETMQTLPASAEQCLGLASAATCEEAGCQVAAVRLCVARSALYAVVLIS